MLWYWPRKLPAIGHLSHDTDGNAPKLAERLLETLRAGEVNSTWCVILPGYTAELMSKIKNVARFPPLLVDQGTSDQFLENQLHPHLLEQAAKKVGYPLTLRRQPGYDHGYYFIATFMEDHLRHHARTLTALARPR